MATSTSATPKSQMKASEKKINRTRHQQSRNQPAKKIINEEETHQRNEIINRHHNPASSRERRK